MSEENNQWSPKTIYWAAGTSSVENGFLGSGRGMVLSAACMRLCWFARTRLLECRGPVVVYRPGVGDS